MEPYLKVFGFTHTNNVDGVKICKIQGNPHVLHSMLTGFMCHKTWTCGVLF